MPTRRLPAHPNLEHLKHQAKDLLSAQRSYEPQAFQRLREFHPRTRGRSDDEIAATPLALSDAQLAIAREYGFPSWPKLKAFVENTDARVLDLPAHERIADPTFRRAVDLMDAGDVDGVREHIMGHPAVVLQRVTLFGGNYFQHPTLLEFIAENPTRRGTLPGNAADVARIILDAGGKHDRDAVNSALALVASSSVARHASVKKALLELLCEYGADPNAALLEPLLYGEFDAAETLLARGATMTLTAAAALGRDDDVRELASFTNNEDRRLALALAAQHGHAPSVRALLDAGVDANGFIPVPGHSHATPLHQAALSGNREIVQMLIDAGADPNVRDILYGGQPADWAAYNHFDELAAWLRSSGDI